MSTWEGPWSYLISRLNNLSRIFLSNVISKSSCEVYISWEDHKIWKNLPIDDIRHYIYVRILTNIFDHFVAFKFDRRKTKKGSKVTRLTLKWHSVNISSFDKIQNVVILLYVKCDSDYLVSLLNHSISFFENWHRFFLLSWSNRFWLWK